MPPDECNLRLVDAVRAVADGYDGATPAQVALAWLLARGGHVADLAELDALPAPVGARY